RVRRPDAASGAGRIWAAAGRKGPAVQDRVPVPDSAPAPARSRTLSGRRGVLLLAVAAVVIAGGLIAALVPGGGSGDANSHTASGPWRLMIQDSFEGHDPGCNVTLIDAQSGRTIRSLPGLYGKHMIFQIYQVGKFRWQVSNQSCLVTPVDGPGNVTLPLEFTEGGGDTIGFTA